MSQSQQLANRLREVILNGTWIANTNFRHQLEGIDWKLATTKYGTMNTISVLAQHIHYYIAGINNVFAKGTLEIRDQYSFDFTPIHSQDEWEVFQDRFYRDTEQLARYIEELTEEQLNESFVNEKYGSYRRNIDGMIEHSYYHLGQIVLIRKMIGE
ncbi:MAG: DUF1572 domain-containing protein [Flavobacteriales bacterium]|nr:DUF1572 domain-containing protein [Flavobacteriales bacterium]MCB9197462.1 DUF1572 domain-containing protein [Flavobacteriales bacterium]